MSHVDIRGDSMYRSPEVGVAWVTGAGPGRAEENSCIRGETVGGADPDGRGATARPWV